ncbi:rab GTPase-activating protein 22-like isoform X1 [Zingiber officinale]|uniref:rab GTPase-activating protein 22-like isoform X1 n=1 Tax=Zingiber officinale TaxID=94328 RepID=UPI001C4B518C|nr:rab GTPase-activating protein 22-like isoform X1 [Zingiber officinale]XP_042437504.1 rab GTPase-activating protein 22-like isoform X1 [Zingiber officinale]
MWVWNWVGRGIGSFIGSAAGDGGGWIWISAEGVAGRWHEGVVVVGVTAMAGLALAATLVISTRRGSLRSPWSRRKRKHPLARHQWSNFFTSDGKLRDGGIKFLKKARIVGIDPSIRPEVWPFLLGVYDLRSSKAERNVVRAHRRKVYEKLRRRCWQLLNPGDDKLNEMDSPRVCESVCSSVRESLSIGQESSFSGTLDHVGHEETGTPGHVIVEENENSGITCADVDADADDTESSYSESSSDEEPSSTLMSPALRLSEADPKLAKIASSIGEIPKDSQRAENFTTWQRIMRLDAVRANDEWKIYNPSQVNVSRGKAIKFATCIGLKDYEHLEPCRIYHAARLVAILEAYALYDPEIGYCQGMSDLLSPVLAVVEEDHEAFWCFVGFMRKARHNFRLDEVGIRRQLSIVSKIIKSKDAHLYRHLEKLQAEDCFFVYRMVVIIFRRELTFEQTLCLWEVMWADQAAIRAGIGKSIWGRIRLRAPPTDDLLLYAIAASVLQRRKLIIEKYSSMDEILRECNSMAGQLDIWKLLGDAHDLVVSLHDKIE